LRDKEYQMYCIGIDVAKYKHCLAVISEGGEKIIVNHMFANSTDGFKKMLELLASKGITCVNARIGLESTGHYGQALVSHLSDEGFAVCMINPLMTHNFRKAQSVRKVKTDAVDALAIAQWLLAENPPATRFASDTLRELKSIARFRTSYSQIIGDCKRKVICLLDQVFPEYHTFFSDVFGKASMAVLARYQSASALSIAHIDALASLLSKSSHGRLGMAHAQSLKSAAKASFGVAPATDAMAFELRQLLDRIAFTRKQMSALDAKMASLMDDIASPITTIPGIGNVCGPIILGEIGDISRFASASKLVAFAGLDPSVYESGEFSGSKSHLSKRGSPYLRWALWLAADRARMFDPRFEAVYVKKRAEGKCHKVALCNVIRKLCNVIFAVLRDNEPYVCKAV
jgi:transposase